MLTGIGSVNVWAEVKSVDQARIDNAKDAIQSRIIEYDKRIAGVKEEIRQLEQDMQSSKDKRQKLISSKPVLPDKKTDNDRKKQYMTEVTAWQKQIDEINSGIDDTSKRIANKKEQLASLQYERDQLENKNR